MIAACEGRGGDKNITIFDAITGSQSTQLFGHTSFVCSLAFSFDGTLLVSGSFDASIKLWDIQTGGIIKTFYGHTKAVCSVSISADNTTIASSSRDELYVWDIETGRFNNIEHPDLVHTTAFSPVNPQLFLSVFESDAIQQWRISGCCIGSPFVGSHAAFSSDGTQLASCYKQNVTILDTENGGITAKLDNNSDDYCLNYCCFSPDGRLVAAASTSYIIYLWKITSSNLQSIRAFAGHRGDINTLIFSSSYVLISASLDKSIKFWEVSPLLVDSQTPEVLFQSPAPTPIPIKAVGLQKKDKLFFSVDSTGMVAARNISYSYLKECEKIQAAHIRCGDMQLVHSKLVIVWCEEGEGKVFLWDIQKKKKEILLTMDNTHCYTWDLRIVGDESRVFHLYWKSNMLYVQTWTLWTGELIGEVEFGPFSGDLKNLPNPFSTDHLHLLVHKQGWCLGAPGSTPIKLSDIPTGSVYLDILHVSQNKSRMGIMDRTTGKEALTLCDRYAYPSCMQWDGQYLIAGYGTGEVLVLDFSQMTDL